MFIRTERSTKEFMRSYPIVTGFIIIYLGLWLIIDLFQLPIGRTIYMFGVGNNFFISQGEYWRLITPMFLHAGMTHVLFNSFSLVLFGPALEQMLGKFKFIGAYLGAGTIANVATYFLGPSDIFYNHVGASGAIYGLFGLYMYMVIFRKDLIDQASAQIVVTIFVIGLVMTFVRPNINIFGHIFGFIGGLALAPTVLRNVRPFSPWQQARRKENDGSISFDPNRWNKKRMPKHVKKKIIWTVIGILIFLGLLNRIGIL